MDAALRRDTSRTRADRSFRFNPCFDGCRPATRQLIEERLEELKVSILVLMDAALRPPTVDVGHHR